jgi:hypothetical protein
MKICSNHSTLVVINYGISTWQSSIGRKKEKEKNEGTFRESEAKEILKIEFTPKQKKNTTFI